MCQNKQVKKMFFLGFRMNVFLLLLSFKNILSFLRTKLQLTVNKKIHFIFKESCKFQIFFAQRYEFSNTFFIAKFSRFLLPISIRQFFYSHITRTLSSLSKLRGVWRISGLIWGGSINLRPNFFSSSKGCVEIPCEEMISSVLLPTQVA